ncbi:MAG: biotin/lipoyl-binding protein, partial [Gammaproteobacteria bacterium]|nr:biotin/lipoyl-binding protein [Gammaproteobacteria bacterium]
MSTQEIRVPDLGGAESVEVIELCVTPGAELKAEDPVVVVESDKATVELPAPTAGRVVALSVKVGDRVRTGDVVGVMDVADTTARNAPAEAAPEPVRETTSASETEPTPAPPPTPGPGVAAPVTASVETTGGEPAPAVVHAGPAVRKL